MDDGASEEPTDRAADGSGVGSGATGEAGEERVAAEDDAGGGTASGPEKPFAGDAATSEHLALVARRADLLRALADGPRAKADLVAALPVSRATVDRGLRELEGIEAVTRTEAGYRLRLPGRLLCRIHGRYRRRIEGTVRAARLLAALPADLDLDPAVVEGADVVTAGGPSLHRPINRQRAMIEDAEHVRGFWAVVPKYAATYQKQAANHDTTLELVVSSAALERLLGTCTEPIQRGLSTGHLALREHDTDLPCNLVVCEHADGTKLGVTVHDDDGVVGFLESECPNATDWGRTFFERNWEAADPLVPPDAAPEG